MENFWNEQTYKWSFIVFGTIFILFLQTCIKDKRTKNWQTKTLSKSFPFVFNMSKIDLPEELLEGDEKLTASIDFSFVPNSFSEKNVLKFIFLTNKRLLLVRFASFSRTNIVFRSIPFSEINSIKMVRVWGESCVQLELQSGEIYQIVLNKRLLSSECVQEYEMIMQFFQTNTKFIN